MHLHPWLKHEGQSGRRTELRGRGGGGGEGSGGGGGGGGGVEEEEGLGCITVDFGQSKTFHQRILILTRDVAPGDWSVPI